MDLEPYKQQLKETKELLSQIPEDIFAEPHDFTCSSCCRATIIEKNGKRFCSKCGAKMGGFWFWENIRWEK